MPSIAGAFISKSATDNAAEATLQASREAIDYQREATQLAVNEARRTQDLQRQLAAPQIQSGGNALAAMNQMMGFGTPSSMAGGFNPATGMWEGNVPFQPTDQITSLTANDSAAKDLRAVNALAATPGGTQMLNNALSGGGTMTTPPPTSNIQLPAAIPESGTPFGLINTNTGDPVNQVFVNANQQRTQDYNLQTRQGINALRNYLEAVQTQQPTQAPTPGTPIVTANPADEQAAANDAYQGRQDAIYGDTFANNNLQSQREALYGKDLATGGLEGQRRAILGDAFTGSYGDQVKSLYGNALASNNLRDRQAAVLGGAFAGPGYQRQIDAIQGDLGTNNLDEYRRAVLGDSPLAGTDLKAREQYLYGDFQADPGYEFRRQEGLRAVQNSAAAQTGALSGAAAKAMEQYGQGLASQEYNNFFNRRTQQANDLVNQRFAEGQQLYNQNRSNFGDYYGRQTNDANTMFNQNRAMSGDYYAQRMTDANAYMGRQAGDAMDYFNRQTTASVNDWNRLTGMAGTGQVQTNALSSNAANTAANIGNLYANSAANTGNALMNGATTAGAYRTAGANALASGIGSDIGLGLGIASGAGAFSGLFGGGSGVGNLTTVNPTGMFNIRL